MCIRDRESHFGKLFLGTFAIVFVWIACDHDRHFDLVNVNFRYTRQRLQRLGDCCTARASVHFRTVVLDKGDCDRSRIACGRLSRRSGRIFGTSHQHRRECNQQCFSHNCFLAENLKFQPSTIARHSLILSDTTPNVMQGKRLPGTEFAEFRPLCRFRYGNEPTDRTIPSLRQRNARK